MKDFCVRKNPEGRTYTLPCNARAPAEGFCVGNASANTIKVYTPSRIHFYCITRALMVAAKVVLNLAIYHLHVSIVSRKTGRSAVAAAAYRSGDKMTNERDGITHDYNRKTGIIYSEIVLPENAPEEYEDRAILWNTVEKAEKRMDAQTAREIDVALPVEFDFQEQLETIREYIQENFTAHGMCADFSMHDKGDGNPHAHILLTTRNVTQEGFGGKNRDWNDKARLESWRGNWADTCNNRLQEKGLDERIDHRTLKAQGIDREPTIHIGAVACAMERAGKDSDRMREYREIIAQNEPLTAETTAEYMHELKQGYVILDKEISAIKQETADLRCEMNTLRNKTENIIERAEYIQSMGEQLEELKAKRHKTGNNKTIDTQIKQLERSYEQARTHFERTYYVAPDKSAAEVKRLEYKAKDIKSIQERLQDKLTPLVEDKGAFAAEYQRQKLLAEISPDGQTIQERLTQLDNDSREGQSTQDNLAWLQSERELNIVTERVFEEIIKGLHPEKAQALITQRKREMEREQSRRFRRERF
jgi:uncharacterized protein YoxC